MGISIEFLILIRVFGNLYEIASESFVFDKFFFDQVVPGGGFEPPTRGFSVHCSTPELPGQGKALCFGCDSTRPSNVHCPEGFYLIFFNTKCYFLSAFLRRL